MPSAPLQPVRDSLTNLGSAAYDDAQVSELAYVMCVCPELTYKSVHEKRRRRGIVSSIKYSERHHFLVP